MTREETLARFKSWCQNHIGNNCSQDDYQMANNIIALLEQEPYEDAIDRWALRAQFNHLDEVYEGISEEEENEAYIYGQIIRAIDAAPPVTPKQRTGKWVLTIEDWNKWTCSECGFYHRTDIHVTLGWNFCPRCGAKMKGEQE